MRTVWDRDGEGWGWSRPWRLPPTDDTALGLDICDTHHDSLITLDESPSSASPSPAEGPRTWPTPSPSWTDGNGPLDPEGIRPDVIELFTSDAPDARDNWLYGPL